MEPLTTTAAIATVVGYLVKKLKDNSSVQAFFNDFTEATVNWIKPFFLQEDGTPKEAVKDLQKNPDSPARQQAIKSNLEVALEDNPQIETWLRELVNEIQQKDSSVAKTNSSNSTGNNNKTYQGISGSTITDSSTTQSHSGNGDNIRGDKVHIGGNVSGTGIAVGPRSYAQVSQGISSSDLAALWASLMQAVQNAPQEKREEAIRTAEGLKAEVSKEKQAEDSKVASLIEQLVGLVPSAVSTVVSTFASPILGGLAGPVTKYVLEKIQGR